MLERNMQSEILKLNDRINNLEIQVRQFPLLEKKIEKNKEEIQKINTLLSD